MPFQRPTKAEALNKVSNLVERYRSLHPSLIASGSKFTETETRVSFIDDFLIAFGWDVRNEEGKPHLLMDVSLERQGSDNDGVWGRPDYRLRVDGQDRMPVEAKRPSVHILQSGDSAVQARTYGWSLSLPASVLTNFTSTIVYDTTTSPRQGDLATVAVRPGCAFNFEEYVDRFDQLWELLSYETISSDRFAEVYSYVELPRGQSPFDRTFLSEFRKWRLSLAQNIALLNENLLAPEVGRRVQKVLNALLFLRVCEDRNISEYKQLLASANTSRVLGRFREADATFNAGIFRALESIKVSDHVLLSVISEMYWPKSQFAFSVLKPEILAGLYEQYLSEQVTLTSDRTASLELKPEIVHAGGIVHTPQYIVDELNAEAINPLVKDGVKNELHVLDMAVGSGTFLLDAFYKLVTALEVSGATVGIRERGEIAERHLFGVDIDGAAVEVTKLGLLLAVIGDDSLDATQKNSLLPSLDANIIAGNSVITDDFDKLFPDVASIPRRRAAVQPTDLKSALGAKYPPDGFDAIIGNPPYVRIQTLSEFMPDQLAYFQDARSGYSAPNAFNFDLSMVFMERALSLLAKEGRLAMIVPHRITNHTSAAGVRGILGPRIEKFVHFGEEQVFPGRSTYSALIIIGPRTTSPAEFRLVTALDQWKKSRAATSVTIERSDLTSAVWQVATQDQTNLFEQLKQYAIAKLGDSGWVHIFVGVQTSGDELFFIQPDAYSTDGSIVEFTDLGGVRRKIEGSILRPAIKDQSISTYDGQPDPDRMLIFPYETSPRPNGGRKAAVLDPSTLQEKFPLAYDYFEANNAAFHARSLSPDPGKSYWAFGRSQSLTQMDDPKLIVRVLSLAPRYAVDREGLVVPGGGDGGPYYCLRPRPQCPYSISVIQAILSHPVVDLFVTVNGKKYRGSYAVHRKAFLVEVPIPALTTDQQTSIEKWVSEAQNISVSLRGESDTSLISSLSARKKFLTTQINSEITDAYKLDIDLLERVVF
ncbi:N-6 DNA methylase [Rhodococcoides fascians A21d2]|uniref:Eco57I restriction-modification methylase domain-containing protein n=1 Tax=Rhodococcoides fascians TaxID=1828 RepID=UPI0005682B45|nr:N-6 DNA methylase [Rhodococcus fascians]QII02060.1 N-6 DNA methylase [Rhodococcus fascians A21d2]